MTKKIQKELRHNSESFEDAVKYLKESCAKKKRNFNETLDIAIMLGIDPKQSTQNVKGFSVLPHGTGKSIKVIVITPNPDLQKDATTSGAIKVGFEDLIAEIDSGYLDFDTCIATPDAMQKLSKVAKKLGPRGLMPNPKTGTVTMDVAKAVKEVKAGKIDFKVDKTGIIHAAVAKSSFEADKIAENANELLQTIIKLKPTASKGAYIKSIFMSSTMSPSVEVDVKSVS